MMTADVLEAFDRFVSRIDERYAEARRLLAQGNLNECQRVLADIARTHAKTSLSLRSVLIRRGMIRGED